MPDKYACSAQASQGWIVHPIHTPASSSPPTHDPSPPPSIRGSGQQPGRDEDAKKALAVRLGWSNGLNRIYADVSRRAAEHHPLPPQRHSAVACEYSYSDLCTIRHIVVHWADNGSLAVSFHHQQALSSTTKTDMQHGGKNTCMDCMHPP